MSELHSLSTDREATIRTNTHETSDQQGEVMQERRSTRWLIGIAAAVALLAIGAVAIALPESTKNRADVSGQGGEGTILAADGASIARSVDSFDIGVSTPTPVPGSYTYPTADMAPEGATHPEVIPGSQDEPEVFTMWAFVFNRPDLCTDGACDTDDIGDTSAQGGVFQLDGHIAGDDTMQMAGAVRLGQPAMKGSPMSNPIGSEVHVAIAPHGKALTGEDLWAQLNGPIGNPSLWWSASFTPG